MANDGKVQCPTMVNFNRDASERKDTPAPAVGGSNRLELESTNADFVTRHFRR